MSSVPDTVCIGVLALQGAFREHMHALSALAQAMMPGVRVTAREVRTSADLDVQTIQGLILPGGESTTMALVAKQLGVWDALVRWVVHDRRPTWVSRAPCTQHRHRTLADRARVPA